jgi:hypothetical protein
MIAPGLGPKTGAAIGADEIAKLGFGANKAAIL